MRGFSKRFLCFTIALVIAVLPGANSFALSATQLDIFSQNNILFYDPEEDNSCLRSGRTPTLVSGMNLTWIGDSYSVGAKDIITGRFPGVDLGENDGNIQVSKFAGRDSSGNPSGITILQNIVGEGNLRPYLVFALGGNGGEMETYARKVMEIVSSDTMVVFVTSYTANGNDYSASNQGIKDIANSSEYKDRVRVADWAAVARDEYYESDPEKIHPTSAYSEWVDIISNALSSFGGGGGTSSITAGTNQNYAGAQVWSDAEMAAIEENKAIYQEAAERYNFPWPVLAVVHSMETGLRRYNPPAQWDASKSEGVYQLHDWAVSGKINITPSDSISEEEFREQTFWAAELLSSTAGDLNNPDNVKNLFFGYNGRARQYKEKAIKMGFTSEQAEIGEGSFYVMNRYDEQRDPTSPNMSQFWPGRFVRDGVYDPTSTSSVFGAFVKYEALGGGGASNDYCPGDGLKSGGMTLEEAQELVAYYKNEAIKYENRCGGSCCKNSDGTNDGVTLDGVFLECYDSCGNALANCVAFSRWFLSKYTTLSSIPGCDGGCMVSTLINDAGLIDGGHTPRVYAIFSKRVDGDSGHTGVVLGIDEASGKMIIGEAGCGAGIDYIGAKEVDISTFSSNIYTYAYTDQILKGL